MFLLYKVIPTQTLIHLKPTVTRQENHSCGCPTSHHHAPRLVAANCFVFAILGHSIFNLLQREDILCADSLPCLLCCRLVAMFFIVAEDGNLDPGETVCDHMMCTQLQTGSDPSPIRGLTFITEGVSPAMLCLLQDYTCLSFNLRLVLCPVLYPSMIISYTHLFKIQSC